MGSSLVEVGCSLGVHRKLIGNTINHSIVLPCTNDQITSFPGTKFSSLATKIDLSVSFQSSKVVESCCLLHKFFVDLLNFSFEFYLKY